MAVLVSGRSVDLAPHQLRTIEQWARDTPWVVQVWLFGSRVRGDSTLASDVDLCITMRAAGKGNAASGIDSALREEWQRQLAHLLEVNHVSLEGYPPEEPATRRRVDREAVLVWRRA